MINEWNAMSLNKVQTKGSTRHLTSCAWLRLRSGMASHFSRKQRQDKRQEKKVPRRKVVSTLSNITLADAHPSGMELRLCKEA